MMDQIVKAVAKKTKMPEAVAQIAVETVISTLKKKLPPAMATALDALLGTQGAASSSKAKSSKSKKDDSLLDDIGSIAGKLLNKK